MTAPYRPVPHAFERYPARDAVVPDISRRTLDQISVWL